MAKRSTPREVEVDGEGDRSSRIKRRLSGPWWALAGGASLLVLAMGWMLLAGIAAIGWVTTPDAGFGAVLRLATQALALAHGVPAAISPITVSIVPLGLSLLLIALSVPIVSLVARQAASDAGKTDENGRIWVEAEPLVWRVGGGFAVVYALVLVLVTTTVLGTDTGWPALRGGLLVGGISGLWGAARGVGFDLMARLPLALRSPLRALGLCVLTLVVGGSALLIYALWAGRGQIEGLVESLGGEVAGGVLLLLLQLAYLPNAVLWGISFILGAGVSLGEATSLSVMGSEVGFLPALPLFGAVPPEVGPWAYGWLVFGIMAGALAGAVVVWSRPRTYPLRTTAAGAITGLVVSLVVTAFCLISGGGLGDGRLAWLGPELGRLLVFAPTVLGLSGALAGTAIGLWIRPMEKKPQQEPAEAMDEAEPDPEAAPDSEVEPDPADS